MYLAAKSLEHFRNTDKTFIGTCRGNVYSKGRDVNHLQSSQGEADKTATLHYIDATLNGASHLHIHSPVTDVLVLALMRYPQNTSFITGTGSKRRGIPLASFYAALGKEKQMHCQAFMHSVVQIRLGGLLAVFSKA